jgi:hypothetical protein
MLDTETTGAESAPKKRIPVWTWRDAIWKSDLPSGSKLVCLAIAEFLSDAGKSWRVPVKTIMEMTGLSNRVVAAHLATAKAAGLLAIRREMGPHGRRGVTRYAPCFPEYMDLDRKPAQFMDDQPSDETTRGEPSDETSPWAAQPRDETSFRPSDETSRQESSNEEEPTNKAETSNKRGTAQAQSRPRKPKQAKLDLGDKPKDRSFKYGKTRFPDHPVFRATCMDIAGSIGLSEGDAGRCYAKFRSTALDKGRFSENWPEAFRSYAMSWLDNLKANKRTKGSGTAGAIFDGVADYIGGVQ